jgi:hypothetical protein
MRVLAEGAEPVTVALLSEGACHVCGEEEEADNDLLLHCDACRVYVHQACYGVADAPDGRTWLCDVCKAGACASVGQQLARSQTCWEFSDIILMMSPRVCLKFRLQTS